MRPAKGAGPKPSNSIILVPRSNIVFLFYKFDYLSPITALDSNLQSCDYIQGKPTHNQHCIQFNFRQEVEERSLQWMVQNRASLIQ